MQYSRLHFVRSLIADNETMSVSYSVEKSYVDITNKPNHVNFSPSQAFAFERSLEQSGLDPLTFGFGMNLLHEATHTLIGHKIFGKSKEYSYFTDGSMRDQSTPGKAGELINVIRGELGLAKRAWYPWVDGTYGGHVNWIRPPYRAKSREGIGIYEPVFDEWQSKYSSKLLK